MSDDPRVDVMALGEAGFADGATYDRGRPDYPAAAIELLRARFALGPGRRVLDLGAGTGKLTRQLASLGAEVVAVEPSDSMREQLSRALPGVQAVGGSAEAIPLADGSVDVVCVAQAFHWFDAPRALREMARVLRPRGGLALLWNERDESVPWVYQLSAVMRWHACQPYPVGMDFLPVILEGGHFRDAERHGLRHEQPLDHAGLMQRVASTSYITAMASAERTPLLARVAEYVATLPQPLSLPYVTETYLAQRA